MLINVSSESFLLPHRAWKVCWKKISIKDSRILFYVNYISLLRFALLEKALMMSEGATRNP